MLRRPPPKALSTVRSLLEEAHRRITDSRFASAKSLLRSSITDLPFSAVSASLTIPSPLLLDMLLRLYSDSGNLSDALAAFDSLSASPSAAAVDPRSTNSYLLALRRAGLHRSAADFLRRRLLPSSLASPESSAIVISGLCDSGDLSDAESLLFRDGAPPSIYAYNSLLRAHLRTPDTAAADRILTSIDASGGLGVSRNAATYTILIVHFTNARSFADAEKAFDEMKERKIAGDVHLYTSVVHSRCRSGDVRRAVEAFDECVAAGVRPNERTYGALIDGFCKAGRMDAAEALKAEMLRRGLAPNRLILTSLVNGYRKKRMSREALELGESMGDLDSHARNAIASALSKLGRAKEARGLLNSGVEHNVVTLTSLIAAHCKSGELTEAVRVFEGMESPNLVTYNALIEGHCRRGRVREAERLVAEMERKGLKADAYTYTSLVRGHCEAGMVDAAVRVFGEMGMKGVAPNAYSYEALITGLARKGRVGEAFGLYEEMVAKGLRPDDRVYASLVGSLHVS
ncbi:hypothetical protein QJS10_CPB04g00815 [Acorus calamus]|uniref:Pentatricopeptide repeat-containing protein n=1 Tax=Acorus calamus TaxID=4465 RepID=A0AAV9EY76_ACOCL|nr:hypothetical protein QJS10_CPB04g00815 [Acorus calamus]